MKLICKIFVFIFILGIYSCGTYNKSGGKKIAKNNTVLTQQLNKVITSYVDSGFVGVVLISDSNNIILNKAYGKSTPKLDANTSFWIASNTKPITAIAILKLQEDGILSTQDAITKYFKNVPPDKSSITIGQLLTHTSGLPNDFICEGEQNMDLAIKKILSQELISQPGKAFNYTNDGYILLASIIELTTKTKYESYIRNIIFMNSGMSNSHFWGDDGIEVDPINDLAKDQPFYSKIFRNGKPLENWNNKGATGISSTALDLYNMIIALKQEKIINQASLRALFAPGVEVDNTNDTILSYGYGWVILQHQKEVVEIRHRGRSDWMHNNSIYLLPNGYIIIAWSKDLGPKNKAWSTDICKNLIQELK